MTATETYDSAVRSIYDAATDPDRWPAALQAIADCTGDVGTVLLWQRDDGSIGTIVSPALQKTHAEYIADWVALDTRAHRAIERGYQISTDAVTDRHVVDEDEVRTLPIYTDYLIPHGLGWFAATSVAPDAHVWVAISVQRRFDRPRFDDLELRLVSQLGRHVEQSLRLGIRLFESEVRATGLIQVLNSMKIGLFGLDGLGRITMSNPVGDALLGKGLTVRDGRLVPEGRADRTAFEALLEPILRDAVPPDPKPLIIGDAEGGRLVLHPLPLGISPSMLAGIGLQPRAIAESLGIAEETARTVLKRVFGKVGVSRQAELVALLARLSTGF